MVNTISEVVSPRTAIAFDGQYEWKTSHAIYLFDQEMSKLGLTYFAIYRDRRFPALFTIYVSDEKATIVRSIIARLEKKRAEEIWHQEVRE